MKIGLLLYKNVFGGVETVSITMAEMFHNLGHKVTFIFFAKEHSQIKPIILPEYISTITYEEKENPKAQEMIDYLGETVKTENLDILIGMFPEESYLILKSKTFQEFKKNKPSFKFLMMDHHGSEGYSFKKLFWQHRLLNIYSQADQIITITKTDELFYKKNLRSQKVTNVTNLPREKFYSEIKNYPRNKRFIGIGRLVTQKRFDLLIDAFSLIEKDIKDWQLFIYGDGILKENLEQQIENLNLQHQIKLIPAVEDIEEEMNKADIFVLSSESESYGMVLLESLLMGLPCISFNCPIGPQLISDLLPNSFSLVENKNVNELAKTMLTLAKDEPLRVELNKSIREYRNIINKEKITHIWENILNNMNSG